MTTEIDIDALFTNIVLSKHEIDSVKGIDYGIQIRTNKGSVIDWYAKSGKTVIRGKPSTRKKTKALLK